MSLIPYISNQRGDSVFVHEPDIARIICVTQWTLQVTPSKTNKHCGSSGVWAFSLNGRKDINDGQFVWSVTL
jgi:hypothetical protein